MSSLSRQGFSLAAVIAAALATGGAPAKAQESAAQGAPGATTTIDGRYLPPPPQPFAGEIDTNADQSTP